jgi:hypothetical protein
VSWLAGAAAAGLGLIALQAAVSGKGPDELSGGFKIIDSGLTVLLDPTVPLIPDRRVKAAAGPTNPAPNPKRKQTSTSTSSGGVITGEGGGGVEDPGIAG